MRYIDPYSVGVPERTASAFFFASLAILAVNCVSQVLAFPFQCALIIYAVAKADIKFFPGMFLLMLDKSNFKFFNAQVIKFQIGFAISPQNVFLLICFMVCILGIFRNWYSKSTLIWFVPWLSCLIPVLAMALPARQKGLAMLWQAPIVTFLTPSLYFWGIRVGKTWDMGKTFFISRMIFILAILNGLELLGLFHIFTFAENIMMISLCVACFLAPLGNACKITGVVGSIFAFGCVFFSRYMSQLEKTGYSSASEIGSTFTRLMIILFGGLLLAYFLRRKIERGIVRVLPYIALVFCFIIMTYAVRRASSNRQSDVVNNDYQSFLERFEYKLVGDRGSIWSEGLRETLTPPYFIKDLESQMVMGYNYSTGKIEMMIKLLPHNQVLTLLARSGWWFGLVMVLFLWWTHIRAFNCASNMLNDKIILCTLLSPYAAIFITVGLTGQSVLSHLFCSNGLVTMIYPGIIYGVWENRLRQYIPR